MDNELMETLTAIRVERDKELADLTGQVERMSEAIEHVCALAAHVIGDSKITSASPTAYRFAQEANDVLRAALGGAA